MNETWAVNQEESSELAASSSMQPPQSYVTIDVAMAPEEEAERRRVDKERQQHEAAILAAAVEIKKRRSYARLNPYAEHRKGKTHWDHVLEEMVWLAKEFQRERRWKIQQARKAANAVARSKLDLESRVVVRAQEEEKMIRRRAAWIAREVSAFWNKAQQVVAYKVRNEVEARKKEVLDRQLDALLGQTQRYSSLLAARLKQDKNPDAREVKEMTDLPSESAEVAQELTRGFASLEQQHNDENRRMNPLKPIPMTEIQYTRPLNVSEVTDAGDSGDLSPDYHSGEDDDKDDEATLDEEEALAHAEGRNLEKDQHEEAEGLAEDAEMPLEVLLARYGYVIPTNDTVDAEKGPGHVNEPPDLMSRKLQDENSTEQIGNIKDAIEEQNHLTHELVSGASDSNELFVGNDSRPADGNDRSRNMMASETTKLLMSENVLDDVREAEDLSRQEDGDGNYETGEDEEYDDEATIEEEEALLRNEGIDVRTANKIEAAQLEEDANVPVEELLSRYGYLNRSQHESTPSESDRRDISKDESLARSREQESIEDDTRDSKVDGGSTDAERLAGAMEAMAAVQPTGHTLATTKVKTRIPFLLKGTLREYQHIGLDWLVSLYHRRLNGILADEMGLGKTIQTIALLAWLACERGDWGPHLVVVPTSVMLNWEMEFKRWCPAFKLLTYYGSPKQRAEKRQGWSKPNAFHVCITSYTLVLQDARMFKRKKWRYLILDEAHMIKNWRSQRWQTLLNFNSKRRLLITGTPLQNDLMELWSLMHFLMPEIFASHAQFKDWFSNPLTGMVEGSAEYNRAIVDRLHAVLRPFLLRRLKKDVEKQLPGKHEHVVRCRLSKRQRQLYEEYMASGDTRATLSSGNFLGIMNCLMQLRKVCNHPDLFEGRPIISAFDMQRLEIKVPSMVLSPFNLQTEARCGVKLALPGLLPVLVGLRLNAWQVKEIHSLAVSLENMKDGASSLRNDLELLLGKTERSILFDLERSPSQQSMAAVMAALHALSSRLKQWRESRIHALGLISAIRTSSSSPICFDFESAVRITRPAADAHTLFANVRNHKDTSLVIKDMVKLPLQRAEMLEDILREFVFVIPRARAPPPVLWCSHPDVAAVNQAAASARILSDVVKGSKTALLHIPRLRTQLFFPDRRLVQFDCGKLQELAVLLAGLKAGGHRALIFTQMSRMLDILETFLNIHGHTYVRLDGATKPEARQLLMQRFNTDPRIFCFILSTRSGGVGMNLTGADTVIFYDSDWNPAMDAQAQDRCHRIGQTREVHIYRLVSEHTIEENILRKSDQKRHLDWLAIQSGGFTTDLLSKLDPKALLTDIEEDSKVTKIPGEKVRAEEEKEAIVAAMRAAEDEGDVAAAVALEKETAAELDEFTREPSASAFATDTETQGVHEGDVDTVPREEVEAISDGREDNAVRSPLEGSSESKPVTEGDGPDSLSIQKVDDFELGESFPTLQPIERYAVRFVEENIPVVDADELIAEVEANYKVEEFDVDAIEAAEEEREAEIDDDEEANMVIDWDQDAANKAFEEQRQAAEAAEKERENAEAAWLAQYGLLPGAGEASGHAGPNSSVAWEDEGADAGISVDEVRYPAVDGESQEGYQKSMNGVSTNMLSRSVANGRSILAPPKRFVRYVPRPWQPPEDLVLSMTVYILLARGMLPSHDLFRVASDVMSTGSFGLGMPGSGPHRTGRSAGACAERYKRLQEGLISNLESMEDTVRDSICRIRSRLAANLQEAEDDPSQRLAVSAVFSVLQQSLHQQRDSGFVPNLSPAYSILKEFDHLRSLAQTKFDFGSGREEDSMPPAGPIEQAQAIAESVKRKCGSGASRIISQRLPLLVKARHEDLMAVAVAETASVEECKFNDIESGNVIESSLSQLLNADERSPAENGEHSV